MKDCILQCSKKNKTKKTTLTLNFTLLITGLVLLSMAAQEGFKKRESLDPPSQSNPEEYYQAMTRPTGVEDWS